MLNDYNLKISMCIELVRWISIVFCCVVSLYFFLPSLPAKSNASYILPFLHRGKIFC